MAGAVRKNDLNLAKKLHRFPHATGDEMKMILEEAGKKGKIGRSMSNEFYQVHAACDTFVSSGKTRYRREGSLSHVNKTFNDKVQADLVTVLILEERYDVLNIVNTGTRYGERVIDVYHRAEITMNIFEKEWNFARDYSSDY